MKITDKIFGELEYHSIWEKKITVSLWEKDVETILFIEGEEDGVFEEEQYIAYQSFMKSWDTENGIGIRFLDEEIDEIGYSHVAM